MMISKRKLFSLLVYVLIIAGCCNVEKQITSSNKPTLIRTKQTQDSLCRNYSIPDTHLLL